MKTFVSLLFFCLSTVSVYAACTDYSNSATCNADTFCVWRTGGGPPRCVDLPNAAPIITAPNSGNAYSASIAENTTLVADVDATDSDGNPLSYSLNGTDAGQFNIDSNGIITFNSAPDFENPSDSDRNNIYIFTVTVSDTRLSDSQSFTITVTNVNDNPVIITDSNAAANTVAENASIGTTVGIMAYATDADIGATITGYSLTNNAGGLFAINPSTGVVTVAGTLDYETAASHTITVRAISSDGSSSTKDFTIDVTDVQEPAIADYHFDACRWYGTIGEVIDSSGNGHNGTISGGLNTDGNGKICRATTFNGTNQYISAPGIDTYLKTTASVSFWIKTTQTGNATMWLAPGVTGVESAGDGNDVFWGWLDNQGRIGIMKGNTAGAKSTNPINDGTWKHIVLTRDSVNGRVQVYVNGVLNQTATSETGNVTTNFSRIGSIEDTGGTPTYFNGSLDEIKVFNKVLSAGEISVIYSNENNSKNYNGATRTCTVCAPPPLTEYRFDECSWTGVTNEVVDSANGYNATAKNNANTTSSDKILCSAADLSVSNKYLELPSTRYIPLSSPWSMTAWVKFPLNPTGHQNISGYNYFILGSVQGGGDLAYFGRNSTNGSLVWGVYSLSGGSAQQAITTPSNGWHFVTFTNDGSSTKFYLDNVYIGSVNKTTTGNVRYIGTSYDNPTGQNMGTLLDEYKLFSLVLSDEQRSYMYSNEAAGYTFNETIRTCPNCTITPEPAVSFDAWDSFRSISDRNISTKIVNKPFDLTIASLNETNNGLQSFTGTVCARLIDSAGNVLSGWNKLTFNSEQSKLSTFTLNRAIGGSDNAAVKLIWLKNASAATACDALTSPGSTIATDRFAVRPAAFSLSTSNAIAGVDFGIIFNAPDFNGAPSASYNESIPGTFDISIAEHKTGCPIGTFTPPVGIFSFVNGTKTLTTRYSEVGVLDINITDLTKPCASRFANIDCDDAGVTGSYNANTDLPIGLAQAQIVIKPHHFDINATLSNFSGDTFTYLSDDLNLSATLQLTATAKNGVGNTTKNYSQTCYAKNTTLTLPHTTVPNPLSQILYKENLTGINNTVNKTSDIILTLNNTVFANGFAALDLDFNFDRSPSKPLNPFDFIFTSAGIIDGDGVSGTGTPLGNARFVYGRVHAYDVTTNTASAPNPVEFEVYSTVSTGFVSGMPQNVLKWYRNLNHDTAAQGNIIRGGFSAGVSDAAVDTSALPKNGVQIVTVSATEDKTVHLDISPWLWYSPKYTYDYGTACTQHPCFIYDYTSAPTGINGVSSGTFQGTDFTMEPAQNITNKGVKVFR